MSYCRFGWDGNEAYIFGTTTDKGQCLECCACAFGGSRFFYTYGDILRHLSDHRAAGHFISDYVDERIWFEIANPDEQWVPPGDVPDLAILAPNPPQPEEPAVFKQMKALMEQAEAVEQAKAFWEDDGGQ